MSAARTFKGVLEPDGTSLGWTIVKVPFDPARVWPRRKGMRVRGTINGYPLRTSLFRGRDGGCVLLVNKRMQKGAGVTRGSFATISLKPDTEQRPVATPAELETALRQDRALKKWHDALSASHRKAIADIITHPKSAEARRNRAELWAERMMLAMEGERVTPPILEAAFALQPRAREGWEAMTAVRRRGHLMGIFYYQSPESRQKRAQKTIEEALRVANRKHHAGRG